MLCGYFEISADLDIDTLVLSQYCVAVCLKTHGQEGLCIILTLY